MSARRRRLPRSLDELPSLFDSVDVRPETAPAPEPKPASPALGMEMSSGTPHRPEAIRFISFGSGSSGNCAYLGNSDGGILIDAGVDNKTVLAGLEANGIDPAHIAGILLTHDHNDHVRFAYALLRYNRHMFLYCTPRTLNGLLRRHNISRRIKDYHKPIYKEIWFEAGGFTVTAFDTSHDGTDNAGYHIARGNHTFVVATDMGCVTERAAHYIARANYLMLESNYDLRMLMTGRYPEYLKARIVGETGHLDNTVAAAFVAGLLADPSAAPLSHIFLCHLSADNNTPAIALDTMRDAITGAGVTVGDASGSVDALAARVQLTALPRFDASPLYVLRR